jgi:hypothetical protein
VSNTVGSPGPSQQPDAPTGGASAGTLTASARKGDLLAFRAVMVAFAVLTVVSGAIIGLAPLGLDDALSRQISSVLLLAGVGDTLVLRYWDRLFGT